MIAATSLEGDLWITDFLAKAPILSAAKDLVAKRKSLIVSEFLCTQLLRYAQDGVVFEGKLVMQRSRRAKPV